MIYRCRACQHEEARGCLPAASCGLYLMFLLWLSVGCMAGAARGLRALVGDRPAPVEAAGPVGAPWWAVVVSLVVGLPVAAVGMWVMKFALESAEWLAFARRRCLACGARQWSRGFTRGYGL